MSYMELTDTEKVSFLEATIAYGAERLKLADELAMAARVQYEAFGAHQGLIDALLKYEQASE